jgi:uncharacterized membrane protein
MVRFGWLRMAVAGAVMLTATMTATAAAVVPTAPQTSRPGPDTGSTTRSGGPASPRSQFPGFVLDQGRYRTSPHGFLWERGKVTRIDVPGAVLTVALDINNRAQVVGQYLDADGRVHGYLWDKGRFTTIDVPGAPLTTAEGLNNRGQIVGFTADDLDLSSARGFLLAKGIKGPVTPISVPGAPRTVANGLNDRGQIVGIYENPNATPSRQRAGGQPLPGMGQALTAR